MWHKCIDLSLTGRANADMSVLEFMTNDTLLIFLKSLQIAKKKKNSLKYVIILCASLDWKQFIQFTQLYWFNVQADI